MFMSGGLVSVCVYVYLPLCVHVFFLGGFFFVCGLFCLCVCVCVVRVASVFVNVYVCASV